MVSAHPEIIQLGRDTVFEDDFLLLRSIVLLVVSLLLRPEQPASIDYFLI